MSQARRHRRLLATLILAFATAAAADGSDGLPDSVNAVRDAYVSALVSVLGVKEDAIEIPSGSSILDWKIADPGEAGKTSAAASTPARGGFAFEAHQRLADSASIPIDIETHRFRSGEQVVLYVRTTHSGRVEVWNDDPEGATKRLLRMDVRAGVLFRIGPLAFHGPTGTDTLRVVLSPCDLPATAPPGRDIVPVKRAPEAPPILPPRKVPVLARAAHVAYALDGLRHDEAGAGTCVPRELEVRLLSG